MGAVAVVGGGIGRRMADLARPLRVRDLRTLWLAQLASELGDWASRIALAVLVFDRTHSPLATGLVTTASLLPYAGLGPLTAAIADRRPRKQVMVAADLMRGLVFVLLAVPGVPTAGLLVGALVAGLATPPFEAARSALRADLVVDDDTYSSYNALAVMTGQVAVALGYLCGGGLILVFGARGTLGLNAASFFVSALLVSRLRSHNVPAGAPDGLLAHLKDGAGALFGDPALRICVILGVVASVAGTIPEALAAAFEHASPTRAAFLLAAAPVALIVASAAVPVGGDDRSRLRMAAVILAGGGALAVPGFALGHSFLLAVFGWAAAGTTFAVIVAAGPVVRRRLPARSRAVAFGLLQSATLGGACLGGLAGGALADRVGVLGACLAGCGLAVATGTGLLMLMARSHSLSATAADEVVADMTAGDRVVVDDTEPQPVLVLS